MFGNVRVWLFRWTFVCVWKIFECIPHLQHITVHVGRLPP